MKKSILATILAFLAGAGAVAQSRKVSGIGASEAKKLMESGIGYSLLDVRTAEEYESGFINGAKLLPYDRIDAASAASIIPAKDSLVIVYCRSGRRSAIAAQSLLELGYTRVYDLGGVNSWTYGLVKPKPGK